jgi:hypothetical protein
VGAVPGAGFGDHRDHPGRRAAARRGLLSRIGCAAQPPAVHGGHVVSNRDQRGRCLADGKARAGEPDETRAVAWRAGTVLGTVGAAITRSKGLSPHWYSVALAVLAIPQSWIGGKLYLSNKGGQ